MKYIVMIVTYNYNYIKIKVIDKYFKIKINICCNSMAHEIIVITCFLCLLNICIYWQ